MIIFLDTATIDEMREMSALGIIDGLTRNPSLMTGGLKAPST
jgi:transaldolase